MAAFGHLHTCCVKKKLVFSLSKRLKWKEVKATMSLVSTAVLVFALLWTLLIANEELRFCRSPLFGEIKYLNRSIVGSVTGSMQAKLTDIDCDTCRITCSFEIVESIPENISFDTEKLPKSTYSAWSLLIALAEKEINIAAYKSSLRGKHVLTEPDPSTAMGEKIFEQLLQAGIYRDVTIRMVENDPPKDRGDNADGRSLESRGAILRRRLNLSNEYGGGTMHSKFFVVDSRHFYLGSANLDWRSLNQKMELGVLVLNCPCLANDLQSIFFSYWNLASRAGSVEAETSNDYSELPSETIINGNNPLVMFYHGAETKVFLASSPRNLNNPGRTWDLEAIVTAIDSARSIIYIHVMDFIPMIVYGKTKSYWPVIDNALRRAVIERGVEVKILAAALHFVNENLHFLQSLQTLAKVAVNGSIEIKIFKVPVVTPFHKRIARDRRTHNKFMVTEDTVVIGTSNWSGDYFTSTTGIALVARQEQEKRPLVEHMRDIFLRDWRCPYAHSLNVYMKLCLEGPGRESICEVSKPDTTLL